VSRTPRLRWLGSVLVAAVVAGCGGGAFRKANAPEPPLTSLPRGAKLLPARIRRLTNLEVERSVAALTGLDVALAEELPPDVRQEGYTPNAAQDVSAAWAARYSALVREAARRAAHEPPFAQRCQAPGPECASRIVHKVGPRAYRRPLDAEEESSLDAAFVAGTEGNGGVAGGVEMVLRALMESPSFLYVTELGDGGAPGTTTKLDGYETASVLSYMLRGGPPDDELLDAARSGALAGGSGRARQAMRLLGMQDTRYQFRRFALEWLEVDDLSSTAKSAEAFPRYEARKPHMLAETQNFVDEVMVHGGASVRSLLAGGFASVDPEMARFYGMHTYGSRASVADTGRLGVLQQASFLAAHAHEDVTSPVKRGDFVLRKVLCHKVKRPSEVGLEVVMPAPSDKVTNRQRFASHAEARECAQCHDLLDGIGFTFEGFDAEGARQTSEHGHPIVTQARVSLAAQALRGAPLANDATGPRPTLLEVENSGALSRALAADASVSECFARQAFRYFSAQSDPGVEASFVGLVRQLSAEARENLIDVLLAYVASDLFVLREVLP
jgi:hypothetical protein